MKALSIKALVHDSDRMQRHVVVILRIACLTKFLLGIVCLHRLLLATDKPATVFDTVYAQCIVILVSLVYYCVCKFCLAACYPPKVRARRVSLVPRDADGNYVDMQLTTATEVIRGAPRLNIQNVWVFVYGVGFVLFISGYCVLGLHPLCPASFGCGLGVLALDEIVCPRSALSKLYVSVRVSALLACMVSLFLVCVDLFRGEFSEFAKTLDLYSVIFGLCLPLLSHFLMIAVRDSRRFSIGSVVELCEFGLPFTVFLGVFHICVAYGQRFELGRDSSLMAYDVFSNETWDRAIFSTHVRTDGPFVLFYCLGPLLVCPFVLGYVSCVMEGSGIDPMLAVALSLCVHFLVEGSVSTLGVYGVVCCAVAIAIRVMGEFSPQLRPHPQSEPSQLNQQVVWERHARRVEVAAELTRGLDTPELDEQVVWERHAGGAVVAEGHTRDAGTPERV